MIAGPVASQSVSTTSSWESLTNTCSLPLKGDAKMSKSQAVITLRNGTKIVAKTAAALQAFVKDHQVPEVEIETVAQR